MRAGLLTKPRNWAGAAMLSSAMLLPQTAMSGEKPAAPTGGSAAVVSHDKQEAFPSVEKILKTDLKDIDSTVKFLVDNNLAPADTPQLRKFLQTLDEKMTKRGYPLPPSGEFAHNLAIAVADKRFDTTRAHLFTSTSDVKSSAGGARAYRALRDNIGKPDPISPETIVSEPYVKTFVSDWLSKVATRPLAQLSNKPKAD